MKKSTERKRIKRMSGDVRRLFLHGLISAGSLAAFKKALSSAEKKL